MKTCTIPLYKNKLQNYHGGYKILPSTKNYFEPVIHPFLMQQYDKSPPKELSKNLFPVVVTGASAESLDAFKRLIKAIFVKPRYDLHPGAAPASGIRKCVAGNIAVRNQNTRSRRNRFICNIFCLYCFDVSVPLASLLIKWYKPYLFLPKRFCRRK